MPQQPTALNSSIVLIGSPKQLSVGGVLLLEIDSGPGIDEPPQPSANFEVSAGELASRTFGVYIRRFGAYLILVGIPSFVLGFLGLTIFLIVFGTTGFGLFPGVTGADPFSLIMSFLGLFGPIGTSIVFILAIGIVNTIVLAVLNGAAVKYALDNYGDREAGDIGGSFSHALGRAVTLILTKLIISFILLTIMSPFFFIILGGLMMLSGRRPSEC